MKLEYLCIVGYDEFWKVKLTKTSSNSTEYKHIINDYVVQADITLNSLKKIITFPKIKILLT